MVEGDVPRVFPHEGRYVSQRRAAIHRVIHGRWPPAATVPATHLLIPHQALRISQMVALGFDLPEEKLISNIQRYGNTTAASIGLALYEALEQGRVHDGSLICLAAFGAGFTWASVLIRW
jgi:3-oxoacyl-[acyl-carrier-protein] synthase III